MANKENSAPKEARPATAGAWRSLLSRVPHPREVSATNQKIDLPEKRDFLKDLATLKKMLPPDKGGGPREITLELQRADNGNLEILVHIPNRYMKDIEAIVRGEKESKFGESLPKPDLVKRALLGEFEPLISRFERGDKLTDKERRALAKIARGELPRIGRPPESKTELRNRKIVKFAKILKRYGGRRVADVTAKKFDVDRSYVSKLMKRYPGAATATILWSMVLSGMGADQDTIRRGAFLDAGISEDDLREATGRKQKVRK